MTPHKNLANLPVDDQLKLLRNTIDDIQLDTSATHVKLQVVQNDLGILKVEIKDVKNEVRGLNRRFDQQDKKFDKLYKLISGFVGRIKSQDEEIGTLNMRVTMLEKPIRAVVS